MPLLLSSRVSVASGGSAGLEVTGKPVHPHWVESTGQEGLDFTLHVSRFPCPSSSAAPQEDVQSGRRGIISAAGEAPRTPSLQWGRSGTGQDEGSCQHWGAQAAVGQGVAGQPRRHTTKPPFPLGKPARAGTK